MSVRIKTLIVICLTFLALLGILYFTSRWFLFHDANIADAKNASRDTTRLLAALDNQIAGLDATVIDWAIWDDTYEFVRSGNPGYIESNIPNNSTFTNIGVELMLFINNSGQIVFGKMVDLVNETEIPIPRSLYSELQSGSRLLSHKDPADKMAGILFLPEGPMIIASQPVVTSQGAGPIRGTLIMGRRLDETEIAKLSQTTQLSINVFPYNDNILPDDVGLARKSLVGVKPIFVALQSATVVSGYTLVNDVYDNPALIFRIDDSRDVFVQAEKSTLYLGLALFSIGLALGLVTMVLLERMIIVRLTSLNSSVMKIGSRGSISSRVEATGNDEIFVLATSVNSMLNALENSQERERESEERYKNLATISPVGIFRTDQNGATIYVNPMWSHISGLSSDEALGGGWLSGVHPEDKEKLTKDWQETTQLHKASLADYRFVHPDGTVAWVMGQANPETNSENQFVGYVGTITDITERKQAEEALLESEEKYHRLFDNTALGIFQSTPEGKAISVNPAFARMFGYDSPEDAIISLKNVGTDLFVDPNRRAEIIHLMEEKPDSKTFENLYRRKDGSTFIGSLNSMPIRDSDGRLVRIEGIIEDISKRKRGEETLRESEQRLATLISNLPGFVYRCANDRNWTTIFFSEGCRDITGYAPEDFLQNKKLAYNDIIRQDYRERLWLKWQTCLENKKAFEDEYPIITAQGETRWLWERGQGIFFEDGRLLFLEGFITDITERMQAEEALRTLSIRQEAILAAVPDILMEVNNDKVYTWANPAGLAFFGEDVIGKDAAFYFEGEQNTYGQVIPLFNGSKDLVYVESWQRRRDGEKRLLAWWCRALKDIDGNVTGVLSSAHDITERKQADEALQKSNALIESIIEQSPNPLWISDVNGTLVRINPACCDLLGITADEVVGTYNVLKDNIVEEQGLLPLVKAVFEAGRPARFEIRYNTSQLKQLRLKGMTSVVLDTTIFPITDANGKITNAVIQHIDITERSQAAEALHQSEEKYRELIDGMTETVWVIDFNGTLVDVNKTAVDVLGFSKEELLTVGLYGIDASLDRENIISLANSMPSDKVQIFETSHKTKNGRVFPVEVYSSIVTYQGKRAILSIVRDITERKRVELELKEYSDHLEEMVEARTRELRDTQEQLVRQEKLAVLGQLAGGVGHELRNPLAVINNAVYYLKLVQPDADDKTRQYFGMIEREVRTAEKIITDLLDFARIKSVDREPVVISELVYKVLERFPVPESVTATLKLPATLPLVYADPRQMEQVLGNLVVNACQAMGEGGKLTISAKRQKGIVAIAVKDTGTGITSENMQKIFEPLFTTKIKGIGLGLAVSKKLAEANEGRIEVQSEPGNGSTFTVFLPVYQKGETK